MNHTFNTSVRFLDESMLSVRYDSLDVNVSGYEISRSCLDNIMEIKFYMFHYNFTRVIACMLILFIAMYIFHFKGKYILKYIDDRRIFRSPISDIDDLYDRFDSFLIRLTMFGYTALIIYYYYHTLPL